MKQLALIIVVIAFFIFSSGCSSVLPSGNLLSTPTSQPSPAPNPPARYSYGDVVMANPNERIGEVIVGYNSAADSYTSRTVTFDDFGQIFYYEGGRTIAMNRASFETQYPYKRAKVDDPYGLPNLNREYSTKYGVGSVVQNPNNPGVGIKIISYDYPRDVYTYVYVRNQGGNWVNDSNTTFEGARTDIEVRYTPK